MTGAGKPAPERAVDARERLLRASFIFHGLDDALVREIVHLSRTRLIGKGTVLFNQGDPGDAFYAVIEGRVRIGLTDANGRALTLGIMEEGDVFGEIALLDGLPRSAGAEALDDSKLLVIDRALFLRLLEREAGLARHIIELLCDRLRENTGRLGEYAFLDLSTRLARRLHKLATDHGRAVNAGTQIDVKLSQTDLAQMLGATREAVNKHLNTWQREGVLSLAGGSIVVRDMGTLSLLAEDVERTPERRRPGPHPAARAVNLRSSTPQGASDE